MTTKGIDSYLSETMQQQRPNGVSNHLLGVGNTQGYGCSPLVDRSSSGRSEYGVNARKHGQDLARKHDLKFLMKRIINIILDGSLVELQKCKHGLNENEIKMAPFEIPAEIKEMMSLAIENIEVQEGSNTKLRRLNSMLITEGIIGLKGEGKVGTAASDVATASSPGENSSRYENYCFKLAEIREIYYREMKQYEKQIKAFMTDVLNLLSERCVTRPISLQQVEKMMHIIKKKFVAIEIQIKQWTCKSITQQRYELLDGTKKPKSISKHASELLSDFFFSHLNDPYPSKELIKELAKRCKLSDLQVSNWLRYRRFRYRDNFRNVQKANMSAVKKAAPVSPYRRSTSSRSTSSTSTSSTSYRDTTRDVSGTPTPLMSPAPPIGPQNPDCYEMTVQSNTYGSQPYNGNSVNYDHFQRGNFANGWMQPQEMLREIPPF